MFYHVVILRVHTETVFKGGLSNLIKIFLMQFNVHFRCYGMKKPNFWATNEIWYDNSYIMWTVNNLETAGTYRQRLPSLSSLVFCIASLMTALISISCCCLGFLRRSASGISTSVGGQMLNQRSRGWREGREHSVLKKMKINAGVKLTL